MAGDMNKSANSAQIKAKTDISPKWTKLYISESANTENPVTSIIVVNMMGLPTVERVDFSAPSYVPIRSNSLLYRIKKWIVSSTATPMMIGLKIIKGRLI